MSSKDFMSGNNPNFVGSDTAGGAYIGYRNPRRTSTPTAGPGTATPAKETAGVYGFNDKNDVVNSNTIPLNLKFLPNLLDAYDVVTYHWKFFISTPAAMSTGKVFDIRQQTIISETGVTDIMIDNVELRSFATPTVETGTGTSTMVKFEILEPAGAGLVDKIFYESIALGIGNWNMMPFYLQLQFKSRTPDTSEAEDGDPGSIGSLRWLWALKVTGISANVTTLGTRYGFEAIIYDDLAQSNAHSTMQHPIVLDNLGSFSDAMSQLQDILNEDQLYKLIDNNGIPDSYRIVVDPELANEMITPANSNKNSVRNNSTSVFNGKNATFSEGTSIDKIIDTLLSQIPKLQEELLGSDVAGAEGKPMNSEESQMKKFWRITTESRPLQFDVRRTDYAREFTYYILKYDIGIMESNVFQDSKSPDTIEAERRRLATYAEKAILRKKYNYIYTGINDQIINLDLKINNAVAQATSRFGGIYVNASMADMGPVAQNHAEEEAAITIKLRKYISFLNTSKTSANSAEIDAARSDLQKSIQSSKLPADKVTQLNKVIAQAKPGNRLDTIRRMQLDSNNTNAAFVAKSLATPVSETNIRLLNDIDLGGPGTKQAYDTYVNLLKGSSLRPMARVDSMQQRQIGQGLEANSNSGIQKLSSMFSVALHSTFDSSYQHMTMTVKGDPFWLCPQPYSGTDGVIYHSLRSDAEAIDFFKNSHRKKDFRVANLFGGDNFIILRFRTPKIYNIEDNPNGENTVTDIATFSGVFKVINVTSIFEKGVFKQILECHLDNNLNILNFSAEIEADAATVSAIPTIVDLTEARVPEAYIKSERLYAERAEFFTSHGIKPQSNVPFTRDQLSFIRKNSG